MKERPLISLIIPVYNVCKYLRQCLDSVTSQSYPKLDVILIDDGSTDGSESICDEYVMQNKNFRIIRTENHGLSAARNIGLENVTDKSEYIAFLDSDDWMEFNAIEKLYSVASNNNADIVVCGYYAEYCNKTTYHGIKNGLRILEGSQKIQSYVCDNLTSDAAWNKLYRRELFDGIRYPEGRIYEDIVTTYKLIYVAKRVIVIPDLLFHYRIRSSSQSSSHSMKNLIDYWLSNNEKYRALSSESVNCRKRLIHPCIKSIGRMWRWYYGCSQEEKFSVNNYLDDMQQFIIDHYREIISEKDYSLYDKIVVILGKHRSRAVFLILYTMNRMIRVPYKNRKYD